MSQSKDSAVEHSDQNCRNLSLFLKHQKTAAAPKFSLVHSIIIFLHFVRLHRQLADTKFLLMGERVALLK